MNFKLTNAQVEAVRPYLTSVNINWGFVTSDAADAERTVKIATNKLQYLVKIQEVFKAQGIRSQTLARHIKLLKDVFGTKASNLESLPEAFRLLFSTAASKDPHAVYLVKESENGVAYAYLPTDVVYEMERHSGPSVSLELQYISAGEAHTTHLRFTKNHLGKTLPDMLTDSGYRFMDAEYREGYDQELKRFRKLETRHAHQFWARGPANVMTAGRDRHWWASNVTSLDPAGKPTKAVLDWEISDRSSESTVASSMTGELTLPLHPNVPVFSLAFHKHFWVHVSNLATYKYDEAIKDKLILPETHSRLISALVSNLTVMRETSEDQTRIIQDKAKSNVILAMGPPGTGKTLTAEVYAESIKRPLYEVASGQLGVDGEEVDEKLGEVLELSLRLNMPLIINEADVFVRERGDDITQNAVCATFLTKLEYHTGIVFLTTNRSVDQAVRSRCIAEIHYGVPEPTERAELWRILTKEFGVSLSDKEIKDAAICFPKVVGRDIQNLLRLTINVCTALKEPVTLKALQENAVFKGIECLKVATPGKSQ